MIRFRGKMRISPVCGPVRVMEAEWTYSEEHDCWYGNGESFPAEICTMIREGETM